VIHRSVQTNGNPLTRGGREEVVSQEEAPTSSQSLFFEFRLPSYVRKWFAFLNGQKHHRNCKWIIPRRQVSLQFVGKISWESMMKGVVTKMMARSINVGSLYVSKRAAVNHLNHSGDRRYVPHPVTF